MAQPVSDADLKPLEIVVFAGSPRRQSYTRSLTEHVSAALRQGGARVELIDLRETPLPPVDPDQRGRDRVHPDAHVTRLRRLAAVADGYVLASPTYHNSYSGILKNALDHLTIRDFRYRPVGLAAHSGRSTQAVDHLRQVVRGVLGVAIPTQVCTRDADFADTVKGTGFYEIIDADIQTRIARFAAELLLFAKHLRDLRAAEAAS